MAQNNTNAIPTSLLMDWYTEERASFEQLKARLNKMQAPGGESTASQADIERIAGQVQGRAEVLISYAAFLSINSLDAAGQLEVASFE